MNKIKMTLFSLLALMLLAGCSVTSEKYRYQQRVDRFYSLLNQEEKADFAAGNVARAGASIEKRVASDKKLAEDYSVLQTEEAINTFDGAQTVRFFREIILRELNRPVFYRFMKYLDAKSQYDFAFNKGFDADLTAKLNNNQFRNFMDIVRNEYRLKGFSNKQIAEFFRSISFPEVSRRELYHVLRILKESSQNALLDFKTGNTASAASQLDQALAKKPDIAADFAGIRERSGLTALDTARFLEVYSQIIMKEMDQGAVSRTLDKF